MSSHPVTVAAADYDGAVRTALLAYKERGRRDLAPFLAEYLEASIRRLDPEPAAVLVPIPSSSAARRQRGENHLLPLTQRVARRLGRRTLQPLRFARAVADSAGLGATDRYLNLAEAMSAATPPDRRGSARSVALVDDIVTSGATLREAERALICAGWTVLGAATVAATPRREHRGVPLEIPS